MRDFCCTLSAAQASDSKDDVKSFSNLMILASKAAKDHHPEACLMFQDFLLKAGHPLKAEMVQTMINNYRDCQPDRLTFKKELAKSVKQQPAALGYIVNYLKKRITARNIASAYIFKSLSNSFSRFFISSASSSGLSLFVRCSSIILSLDEQNTKLS
jgi:hypothetical protein